MKKYFFILFVIYLLLTTYYLLFSIEPEITSKQIEFRKKEEKIIFKENVKIRQKENILLTDLAVKDEKNKIVEMKGNIQCFYVVDETNTIKLNTEFGKWNIEKNQMELWGSPFAVYKSSSGIEVKIHSDKVFYEGDFDVLKFYGNVILTYEKNIIKGNYAEYYYKDKKAIFKKDGDILPVIDYSDVHRGKFTSEQITALLPEKILVFEKNVYCRIYRGE